MLLLLPIGKILASVTGATFILVFIWGKNEIFKPQSTRCCASAALKRLLARRSTARERSHGATNLDRGRFPGD
jgi:hypothetical protein